MLESFGKLRVRDCDIYQNAAGKRGGGIRIEGFTSSDPQNQPPVSNADDYLIIENSRFRHNTASTGGGVDIPNSTRLGGAVIRDSVFSDNSASGITGEGGAIFKGANRGTRPFRLERCVFTDNTATVSGGAVSLGNGASGPDKSVVAYCYFADNQANQGGAIYLKTHADTTAELFSNTFVDNTAATSGAAVLLSGGAATKAQLLFNTVIGAAADPVASTGGVSPILFGNILQNQGGNGGEHNLHLAGGLTGTFVHDQGAPLVTDYGFYVIDKTGPAATLMTKAAYAAHRSSFPSLYTFEELTEMTDPGGVPRASDEAGLCFGAYVPTPDLTISFIDSGDNAPLPALSTVRNVVYKIDVTDYTKDGHEFLGWASGGAILFRPVADETSGQPRAVTAVKAVTDEDLYLYAVYEGDAQSGFTVDFDTDGGTPTPETQTVNAGAVLAAVEAPQKANLFFDGWYDQTLTNKWVFSAPVTGDMTLYAKWMAGATLHYGDGRADTIQKIEIGAAFSPPDAQRVHYTFMGWYGNTADENTKWTNGSSLSTAIDLYAKWTLTPVEFPLESFGAVTYDTGTQTFLFPNGAVGLGYSVVFPKALCATAPNIRYELIIQSGSLPGLNLVGNALSGTPTAASVCLFKLRAYTDSGAQDFIDCEIEIVSASVTVSFDSNNGTPVPSENLAAGGRLSEPTAPTKVGFTFDGWYDQTLTTKWVFTAPVNASMTLYAKWTPLPITFNPPSPGSWTYLDGTYSYTFPAASTEIDGQLVYSANGLPAAFSFDGAARTITTATALPGTYSFTLTAAISGSDRKEIVPLSIEVLRAQGAIELSVPSVAAITSQSVTLTAKNGKTFQFYAVLTENDPPALDSELWRSTGVAANTFTVTRDSAGQLLQPDTLYYFFVKANQTNEYTAAVSAGVSAETLARFTVSFDPDNGGGTSEAECDDGALVGLPTQPTKKGFTFDAWYLFESGQPVRAWNFAADTVSADVVLRATWTALDFTFSGGTLGQDGSIVYNGAFGVTITAESAFDGTFAYTLDRLDSLPAEFTLNPNGYLSVSGTITSKPGTFSFTVTATCQETGNPKTANFTLTVSKGAYALAVTDADIRATRALLTTSLVFDRYGFSQSNDTIPAPGALTVMTTPGASLELTGLSPGQPCYVFLYYSASGNEYYLPSAVIRYGFTTAAGHKLTLLASPGEEIGEMYLNDGDEIDPADLPTPEKTGYDFDAWYTEAACTNEWDFDTVVTENLTLYAKWTEKELAFTGGTLTNATCTQPYTYSFDATAGGDTDFSYALAADSDPLPGGLTISGGNLVGTPTASGTFTFTVEATYLSVAQRKISATFTLTVEKAEREERPAISEVVVTATTATIRSEVGFDLYCVTTESGAPALDSGLWTPIGLTTELVINNLEANTEYYFYIALSGNAQYNTAVSSGSKQQTEAGCPVTFEPNNGAPAYDRTVDLGQKLTKPADPTRTGFTFIAWHSAPTFDAPWDFDEDAVTGPLTLYAEWKKDLQALVFPDVDMNAGGVTYRLDGAPFSYPITPPATDQTFTYSVKNNDLPDGFILLDGAVSALNGITARPNTYAFIIVATSIESGESIEAEFSIIIEKSQRVIEILDIQTTMFGATIYTFPQATAYSYTWTEPGGGGGSLPKCKGLLPGGANQFTIDDLLPGTAYTFVVYLDGHSDYEDSESAPYLAHTQSKHTVTFYLVGVPDAFAALTVDHNDPLSLPELPEMTGWYIDGWYLDESDGAIKWDFENGRVTESINLYGLKTPRPIEFEGGALPDAYYGLTYKIELPRARTGDDSTFRYELGGQPDWITYTASLHTIEAVTEFSMVDRTFTFTVTAVCVETDETMTAEFSITVTRRVRPGMTIESRSELDSVTFTFDYAPDAYAYLTSGESLEDLTYTPLSETTLTLSGLTKNTDYRLYVRVNQTDDYREAIFTHAFSTLYEFDIEFVTDTDQGSLYETVGAAQTVTAPDALVKIGFALEGWYLDEGFAEAWDFSDPVTRHLRLYAKWSPAHFTFADQEIGRGNGDAVRYQGDLAYTIQAPLAPYGGTFAYAGSAEHPLPEGFILSEGKILATGIELMPGDYTFGVLAVCNESGLSIGAQYTVTVSKGLYTLSAVDITPKARRILVQADNPFDYYAIVAADSSAERVFIETAGTEDYCEISGLNPGTSYTVYLRFSGSSYFEETISAGIPVTTAALAQYSVTFVSNGSVLQAIEVNEGEAAAPPAQEPENADHIFLGWYTDEACTQPYDFGRPVESDLTLYAKWEKRIDIGRGCGSAISRTALLPACLAALCAAAILLKKKKETE
ncbi:MAG: InlB B-repeat-containing protein [Clostridiales bacterium]|nr:InlB B-repeat-containing protein [Clostridiales bacterium]